MSPAPAASRNRKWQSLSLLPLVGASWLAIALSRLLTIVAGFDFWVTATMVLALLAALAITLSCVVVLLCQRNWFTALAAVAVSLLGFAANVAVDWNRLCVHSYYQLRQDDFATVAGLADRGEIRFGSYGYGLLPDPVSHLAVDGRVGRIDAVDTDAWTYLLPARLGMRDGAVGFAYFPDDPGKALYDCFEDPCRAIYSLGDGWYWMA